MTDFRERYKRAGYGREDADINRALRSQRRDEARRDARNQHLSQHRDINMEELQDDTFDREEEDELQRQQQQRKHEVAETNTGETELDPGVQKRLLQLEKWREERNKKKLQEKKKAKPVFKVGVVHHKVYSPPLNKEPAPLPPPKLCKSKEIPFQSPPPKRVTRATEKRLAVKAITNQQKRAVMKKRENQTVKQHIEDDRNKQPLAPLDHEFKAPSGIMAIPMFGRHALGAKENMLPMLSPAEVFNETPLTSSSTGRSFIISKSSNLTTDSRKSSIKSNDSLNSTSEAIVLKMSSDGQESLNDLEQDDPSLSVDSRNKRSLGNRKISPVNKTLQKKVPMTKFSSTSTSSSMIEKSAIKFTDNIASSRSLSSSRRSRAHSPSEFPTFPRAASVSQSNDLPVTAEHRDLSNENQVESHSMPLCVKSRRSTRVMSNNSTNADEVSSSDQKLNVELNQNRSQMLEESLESMKKSNLADQMDIDRADTNSNPNDDERLDTSKVDDSKPDSRNSARLLSHCVVQVDKNEVELELLKTLKTNGSPHGADSKNVESKSTPLNKRRSGKFPTKADDMSDIRKSPDATVPNQLPQTKPHNVYNLMDSTLSDLNGFTNRNSTRATIRFSKIPGIAPDQSLIKFSPRQSTILQSAQTNDDKFEATSSTHLSSRTSLNVDESVVKFSPTLERTSTRLGALSVPESATKSSDGGNSSIDSSLDDKPPAFFSPFIVSSRGKSSARKETKRRRFSQASPEDIPTKDTVMLNSTVSPEEEERTAQYYKYLLDKEIERLNERCDYWNVIKEDITIPEDIHYVIQAAVGQTQLLINKKFQRFRSLVLDCETGRGEMLVTCKDLQGFWEMMYMEVKNCDGRFEKLDELKSKNWIENEPEAQPVVQPKKVAKKPLAKKKAVSNKPSSLRAHIMAARKKKLESEGNEGMAEPIVEEKEPGPTVHCAQETISVNSDLKSRRTSTPKSTSKWQNLLDKMQKSQTRKTTSSPLVVMKLSQMCKTPEVHHDCSVIYINSDRTPARSILKTSKDDTLGSVSKSAYKVNFKEQPMEFQEFDPESRVDNNADYDTEDTDQEKEPIERRLDFDTDSFNCSTDRLAPTRELLPISHNMVDSPFPSNVSLKGSSKCIPDIVIDGESPLISMSPLSLTDSKPISSMKKTNRTKNRRQITFEENSEKPSRSGKFSAPLTPIPRSKRSASVDEDTGMEVDEEQNEEEPSRLSTCIAEPTGEIYLNEHGIVSTRIVPVAKNTPMRRKVNRSNSERLQLCTRSLTKMECTETLLTPKSNKRNCIPDIVLSRADTPVVERAIENEDSIPTVRRNAKRSYADITLTEENVDEVSTPKVRRKISKTARTPVTNNDRDESANKSARSVRRAKSLNLHANNASQNSAEPNTPRSKNTTINLDPLSIRDKYVRKTPRSNSAKNLKKSEENLDPNEHGLNSDDDESLKIASTPGRRRKSLKTDEIQTTKDSLTPNGRRKSLRIAQTNSRKED
ncbi:hypothetical protein QAD02_019233 [Eretmocerus hayati]|uniref:Uncharacterized protein n=1 Tax=Eretmocerus hayati TaxID=131215 RepID=A0ACC2PKU8_9HYME|nr:hypothetical protein QAD02_019233 [Eretmocerus hayati]